VRHHGIFAAQGITLCDGQHAEAGLEACDWITEIGAAGWHTEHAANRYGHPASISLTTPLARDAARYQKSIESAKSFMRRGGAGFDRAREFSALESWGKRPAGDRRIHLTDSLSCGLGQGNEFPTSTMKGKRSGSARKLAANSTS